MLSLRFIILSQVAAGASFAAMVWATPPSAWAWAESLIDGIGFGTPEIVRANPEAYATIVERASERCAGDAPSKASMRAAATTEPWSQTMYRCRRPRPKGAASDAGEIVFSRADLIKGLTRTRLVPVWSRPDPHAPDAVRQIDGYKLFAIRQGHPMDRVGLANGDIIRRINGWSMRRASASHMGAAVTRGERLTLEFERRGRRQVIRCRVVR